MESWQFGLVFAASLGMAVLVVLTRRWHGAWTSDFENSGVQKHHKGSPPRVGLLPLLAGLVSGAYLLGQSSSSTLPLIGAAVAPTSLAQASQFILTALLCAVPVLLLGLADDVTKKVPPRVRMAGAAASAILGAWLMGGLIVHSGITFVDWALAAFWPLALGLTILMVAGFTNAMNIVDGLHGLAGGLGVFMLLATAVLAASVGDHMLVAVCLVAAAAVLGFLVLNFPRGLLFLGDGGAYLIGFILVQVWIALEMRHDAISPWDIVAIAIYPTMETIFSIYRRRLHRGRKGIATLADRLHLHSLLYRRRTLPLAKRSGWMDVWLANALASVWIICFALLPLGLMMWGLGHDILTAGAILAGVGGYLLWYRSMTIRGQPDPGNTVPPLGVPVSGTGR